MIYEKSLQLLFILGIGIVVLSLMGTAVLANTGTNIELWVQDIGWGEGDITSPILEDNASIEILLDIIPGEIPTTFVTGCAVTFNQDIPLGTGISDGLVICKILNEDDNAIAEGSIPLTISTVDDTVAYKQNEVLIININQPVTFDATHFDNFFDARLIVEAPL